MDWRVPLSLAIAALALLGSAYFEGTALGFLLAPPTALLIAGGTAAASLLHAPPGAWVPAWGQAWEALRIPAEAADRRSDFVHWTALARRHGTLALEPVVEQENERLIRLGLRALVDGGGQARLRDMLLETAEAETQPLHHAAGLFEAAGGYAPTMGVLGAVLGLIHALQQLDDPQAMGPGVATAFLATLYGLALANLVLLPLAGRLRLRADARRQELLIYLEGVLAVGRLEHPVRLSERLGVDP